MAEHHVEQDPARTPVRELPRDQDIRGQQENPDCKEPDERDSTEGRDRPPSNRGRDPNGPWLGGG